jgi:hypothetical protein
MKNTAHYSYLGKGKISTIGKNTIFDPHTEATMKLITVVVLILMSVTSAFAGGLYSCVDHGGKPIITNNPQDGMRKCVLKDTYRDPTPQERAQEQAAATKAEKKQTAQYEQRRAAQQRDDSNRQSMQEARNRRADQLIEDNKKRIDVAERMGFKLPRSNVELLEKAAEAKANQIRQGTDRPMTTSEDAEFHAREAADDAIRWHELRSR